MPEEKLAQGPGCGCVHVGSDRDEEVARFAEFVLGRIKNAQPYALIGVFVGQVGISCHKETLERAAKMLLDEAIPVP